MADVTWSGIIDAIEDVQEHISRQDHEVSANVALQLLAERLRNEI